MFCLLRQGPLYINTSRLAAYPVRGTVRPGSSLALRSRALAQRGDGKRLAQALSSSPLSGQDRFVFSALLVYRGSESEGLPKSRLLA